jgi:hypothetical protein
MLCECPCDMLAHERGRVVGTGAQRLDDHG